MVLEYTCRSGGAVHSGLPAWHFAGPVQALAVAPAERATRVALTADDCVIDDKEFYVKGLLEVPVHGADEPFTWGVWLSLSAETYEQFVALFHDERRTHTKFFGWLSNSVPGYPETQLLKAMVHVRPYPMRPYVELEPTSHSLAVAQREGISQARAISIAESLLHPES